MPPVTPNAIFIVTPASHAREMGCENLDADDLVVALPANGFRQNLAGNLRGSFAHLPLHLAGINFLLRDAAGLAGVRLHHRMRATLQLAGPPGGDQYIAILAIESIIQLHRSLRLAASTGNIKCRQDRLHLLRSEE